MSRLSDPPFKAPLTDKTGVTAVWRRWFSSIPSVTKVIMAGSEDVTTEIDRINRNITTLASSLSDKANVADIAGKVDEAEFLAHKHIDLEKMINPAFPVSHRVIEYGVYGVSSIKVYSDDASGTFLFERTINYDSGGVLTSMVTDDQINHTRIVKTPVYDPSGIITEIQRTETTWY